MSASEGRSRLMVFLKAGLPFTVVGMVVVLAGLVAVRRLFAGSEHLSLLQLVWLAVFWFIYQPLFKRRIDKVKTQLSRK